MTAVSMKPGATMPRYIAALDGLRGVAVAMVLGYHSELPYLGGGFLGVSTFFTLSGFLITALLLVEGDRTGRIDLPAFWARRARRLLPAGLMGIVLATLFVSLSGSIQQLTRFRWDGLASLFYFSNFRFMTSGQSYWEIFSRPSPLQHYWSLSIEEQFYLVYPSLLLGCGAIGRTRRRRLHGLLFLASAASIVVMLGMHRGDAVPSRLYYGTDTRAVEFLAGALLASFCVRESELRGFFGTAASLAAGLGVVFVVLMVTQIDGESPFLYSGGFTLYAVATTLILNAALGGGALARGLASPPLVWLGRISYAVYVFHWPIWLWLDETSTGVSGARLLLLRLAVVLSLAVASHRLIESPIRYGRALVGRAALGAVTLVTGLSIAGIVFVTRPYEGLQEKLFQVFRSSPMPALQAPAPAGPIRIMVVGDSVAWNLGNAGRTLSRKGKGPISVWNLASFGCGLARRGHRERVKRSADYFERCDSWQETLERNVDRFDPDIVLVLSGLWDLVDRRLPEWSSQHTPGDQLFDDWLVSEYGLVAHVLSRSGSHVTWLTAPCVGPLSSRSTLGLDRQVANKRIRHLNEVILPRVAEENPGIVSLYDLNAVSCPDGTFEAYLEPYGELRKDTLHFTHNGSIRLLEQLLPEVVERAGFEPPLLP